MSACSIRGILLADTETLRAGNAQFDKPFEDLQGNVWLTTASQGLWKWNGSSFTSWPTLAGSGLGDLKLGASRLVSYVDIGYVN